MKNLLFLILFLTACKKEPPVEPGEPWADVRKMDRIDSTTLNQER